MMRFVAAVLKVTFAMNFDILPGKFLAQPVETGRRGHVNRLFALGRVCLLFEKDIDTKRVDGSMLDRCVGG